MTVYGPYNKRLGKPRQADAYSTGWSRSSGQSRITLRLQFTDGKPKSRMQIELSYSEVRSIIENAQRYMTMYPDVSGSANAGPA